LSYGGTLKMCGFLLLISYTARSDIRTNVSGTFIWEP